MVCCGGMAVSEALLPRTLRDPSDAVLTYEGCGRGADMSMEATCEVTLISKALSQAQSRTQEAPLA